MVDRHARSPTADAQRDRGADRLLRQHAGAARRPVGRARAWRSCWRGCRSAALGAQHHQDIPFEQVVELVQPVRSLAHTPLFQVMFAWQNAPGGRAGAAGAGAGSAGRRGLVGAGDAKFDLALSLWEDGGRIAGRVEYATALFDAGDGGALGRLPAARCWRRWSRTSGGRVERLPLLAAAERRRVVEEWNATDAAVSRATRACTSCSRRRWRARRTRWRWSFDGRDADATRELNARANRLAHHLRRAGRGPGRAGGDLRGARRWRWWSRCWRCSRRAAPTCRSTRRTRPSGCATCSRTARPRWC